MANGNHAALKLIAPEIPSTSVPASPPAPPPEQPIEQKIAEAAADIIQVICRSVCEYASRGAMDPETKARTGDVFLRLYELQSVVGEHDFPVVARRQGKLLLRQRYAALRQPGDPNFDERLIDDFLTHALGILARVTADEKIFARARMN